MRKKIEDDEGLIGPKGRSYEIDLCITNEESLIFEIKSYAEEEDIERFNDKAELAIKTLSLKKKALPKKYYTLYTMKQRRGLVSSDMFLSFYPIIYLRGNEEW